VTAEEAADSPVPAAVTVSDNRENQLHLRVRIDSIEARFFGVWFFPEQKSIAAYRAWEEYRVTCTGG